MADPRYTQLKEMPEQRRTELRRNLGVRLQDVRAHAAHVDKHVVELDTADASGSDLEQHIVVTLTEMTGEMLRRVDEAIGRHTSGDFGWCAECGREISYQRPAALPFALRCRECEELNEKRSTGLAPVRLYDYAADMQTPEP